MPDLFNSKHPTWNFSGSHPKLETRNPKLLLGKRSPAGGSATGGTAVTMFVCHDVAPGECLVIEGIDGLRVGGRDGDIHHLVEVTII